MLLKQESQNFQDKHLKKNKIRLAYFGVDLFINVAPLPKVKTFIWIVLYI